MDVAGLKSHIKSNTVPSILYFAGEEWAVQKIFIGQISKVKGLEVKRVDSIIDVMRTFKSKSFVQTNYLYIVRDDKAYMEDDKAQALLPTIIGNNVFILLLTNIDKRTRFYKTHLHEIIEFEALPERMLIKYIQKEIGVLFTEKNCKRLIEICQNDYGRILLELDKLKRYWKSTWDKRDVRERDGGQEWLNKCFDELVETGVIYTPPKDAIFDFVDAVIEGNPKCFNLYEQCKAVGEATLVMISVLYNNAKAVLQVQTCKSNDISKSTGLTGFQIMNAKKHINQRKAGELLNIMKMCRQCEQGIKTGKIEEQFAVEYILVNTL